MQGEGKQEMQKWIHALISDDDITARQILESSNVDHQNYLINTGYIRECDEVEDLFQDRRLRIPGFRITQPLTLVIAFGCCRVLRIFLEYGVNVCQLDWRKNTILHALVYLCYLDEEREGQFVATYNRLCQILDVSTMRKLLYTENEDSKRPLELAGHVGAFEMMGAIFNTSGVYLAKKHVFRTFYEISWYDVTDYETCYPNNRFNRSPLLFLVFIDSPRLNAATRSKLYVNDPFKDWMSKKTQVLFPIMLLWMFLRMFFLNMFLIYHFAEAGHGPHLAQNNTTISVGMDTGGAFCAYQEHGFTSEARHFIRVFLLIYSLLTVIHDIFEHLFVSICTDIRNVGVLPRGHKKYVASFRNYKILQFILMLSVAISMIIDITKSLQPSLYINPTFEHMLYAVECLTLTWSALYFLQIIPFMGYFVISIQAMLVDLYRFSIIFGIIVIPFALSFQRVIRDSNICVEEFQNFPTTVYTTFTIMLNMVDFQQYSTQPGYDFMALALLHMLFVFLVAVLLLNFLIALFTKTISDATENRDVIITIQRFCIFWTLEYRLARLFQNRFYRRRVERTFFQRDGRLYVTRVNVRCGEPVKRSTCSSPEQSV